MNNWEIERQMYFFGHDNDIDEVKVDFKKITLFSRIWNTTIICLHIHINKLLITLIVIMIMRKVSVIINFIFFKHILFKF